MRKFTNYLTVKDRKCLDLFKDIPYEYIENLYSFYDINIEIKDIETDNECFKTPFKFKLDIDNDVEKEFNVILEYLQNNITYTYINKIVVEEEEEIDEEESDEESDEEEPQQ